jgi:hypothetical protein
MFCFRQEEIEEEEGMERSESREEQDSGYKVRICGK